VSRRDTDLVLTVADDGRGLPPGGVAAIAPGVGLSNTRARLAELYGAPDRLTLGNARGGGLVAAITIPFERSGPDEATWREP
jgi:signal transduction histidine kinase